MRAIVFLFALGCGAPRPAPATEAPSNDACANVARRARECRVVYAPPLLALRVRWDLPAGIAARVEQEGEDALLEEVQRELAGASSTDLAHPCDGLDGMLEEDAATVVEQAHRCLGAPTCADFAACDLRNVERYWEDEAE